MYNDNQMSGNEIAEYINERTPKEIIITGRSVQRAIVKYGKLKGLLRGTRTVADSFRLAVKKGRVKWAYKEFKRKKTQTTIKLRYFVLNRDNFKCKLCGDNYLLEVDHIIPLHAGGKSEPDNLQTLCQRCNQGKYQNE